MKRIISLALVLVMLVSSLALSVNATTVTYPTYADAQDGELLYVADFTGDEYYQPSTQNAIDNAGWEWVESETLVANVDETKPNEVSFTKEKKVNSAWGGDIESLPLGEGYAYTIKFTVSRTANKSIGLLFDGHFGCYLQAAKGRLQRNGSKLAGHEFVSYGANPLVTIPGSEVVNEEKPSVQEYAFSINGDNVTYSLYIKEEGGKWYKLDEGTVEERDNGAFGRETLGLYFYCFDTTNSVTVKDVQIFKGDSLLATEGLWTEPVGGEDDNTDNNGGEDEETTTAPKPQKAPPVLVTEEATTSADDNSGTEETKDEKGCGATVGVASVAMIAISALGMCNISFRRKEND